jgi:hypothetical protein
MQLAEALHEPDYRRILALPGAVLDDWRTFFRIAEKERAKDQQDAAAVAARERAQNKLNRGAV